MEIEKKLTTESIIKFEGTKLKAYLDTKDIPTIGNGTTFYPNGLKVKMGDVCTIEEAKVYLNHHLENTVYPSVNKIFKNIEDYSPELYASVCSMAYNCGTKFLTNQFFIDAITNNNLGLNVDLDALYDSAKSLNWKKYDELRVGEGLSYLMLAYCKETKKIDGIVKKVHNKGLAFRRIEEIKIFKGKL